MDIVALAAIQLEILRLRVQLLDIQAKIAIERRIDCGGYECIAGAKNAKKSVKIRKKSRIQRYIRQRAREYGVDAALAHAIAEIESGFNPGAKNPHSTAAGVFQITRPTWEDFRCEGDPYDYRDNTECAMRILSSPDGIWRWGVATSTRRKLCERGLWKKFSTGFPQDMHRLKTEKCDE